MSDKIKQMMDELDKKTSQIAKMRAQYIVTQAQRDLDFKATYDASMVLLILEEIKDRIEEIE